MIGKTRINFVILICFITLQGCQSGVLASLHTPEGTVRIFINALNDNKPSKALDVICESMVIPTLSKGYLRELEYEEIVNDGNTATVRVTGEIRLEDPDLGAAKKELDFMLSLEKNDREWCITRESLTNMLSSVIDLSY